MSDAEIEELLTRFHSALRMEGPLDVNLPADALLYVEGMHGNRDAVSSLRRDIQRTEGGASFCSPGRAEAARAPGCIAFSAICEPRAARSITSTCWSG